MTMLITFVFILTAHWLGDFVLQSHWMASNKSKNNEALSAHIVVYTLTLLALGGAAIKGAVNASAILIIAFVAVNGALHFITDYFTSRWTSRLFGRWLSNTQDTAAIHNFFVVIGFDQLIHHVTLAATMWFFIFFLGAVI